MATTRTSARATVSLTSSRRITARVNDQISPDGYFSRIVKYVPTEFLTIFLFVNSLVDSNFVQVTTNQYWLIFAALLVAYALYLGFATRCQGMPLKFLQVGVSTVLFAVFVYAVGGPFAYAHVSYYQPDYGAVLLPVALFLAGFIVPNPTPAGATRS